MEGKYRALNLQPGGYFLIRCNFIQAGRGAESSDDNGGAAGC